MRAPGADADAHVAHYSLLALQRPHAAAEDQMRGDRLELVEAIEAAVGCNRKI